MAQIIKSPNLFLGLMIHPDSKLLHYLLYYFIIFYIKIIVIWSSVPLVSAKVQIIAAFLLCVSIGVLLRACILLLFFKILIQSMQRRTATTRHGFRRQ